MRLAFMGTPDFAVPTLDALVAAGHEIAAVYTQPPRPAGRGKALSPSPVHRRAEEAGLAVRTPATLRDADEQQAFAALDAARPDVLVVAAYGLILPRWVLALRPLGCLNIHASLLPRWRGAAPIQRAIEAGDAETGITIMQMDEGLDTGDMLLVERLPIGVDDSSATLHDKLAALGGRLVVEALEAAACGGLQPRPQPAEGVTYARKIDKAEAAIDWHQSAAQIERRVRAFDPQPGCHAEVGGESIKIWRSKVSAGFSADPGSLSIDAGRPVVGCGRDGLELVEVQRPGGRRQGAAAWLASRH